MRKPTLVVIDPCDVEVELKGPRAALARLRRRHPTTPPEVDLSATVLGEEPVTSGYDEELVVSLAAKTILTPRELRALLRTGKLNTTVFNTATGRIRDGLKRPMTVAEAGKRLAERRSDGSPRQRCPALRRSLHRRLALLLQPALRPLERPPRMNTTPIALPDAQGATRPPQYPSMTMFGPHPLGHGPSPLGEFDYRLPAKPGYTTEGGYFLVQPQEGRP